MSSALQFGVQSYCFRHFKNNADVARMVREIDLDKIEVCAVHADLYDVEAFKEVNATYAEAGVEIISIGVNTFTGDPREENWFKAANVAGARHISCHFTPSGFMQAIPMVRAWCREYGIRVGIHCHGGYMFGGDPGTLRYLLDLGSPEIGICIDTAWAMQIGPHAGNPVDWVRRLFPGQIYGVHYKDFVFDAGANWQDVIVGEGNLDLPEFVKALDETGFDGMAVIEYEADVEDPVPALKRCVASMREATV
jgi:sugar phosphate isomerase/epimerase